MAKKIAQSKSAPQKATNPPTAKPKSPAQLAVQAAGKITGDLICSLQNERKAFLRIGQLLAEVRDRKHYATLHHPDLEDYADKRLQLGKSSLYRYMKAYAWVREHHPEWLETPPKVRIPDLLAIEGLVWAQEELARKDLSAGRKATLNDVQQKALDGKLKRKELRAVQARTSKIEKGNRTLLSSTRLLRKRYAESKSDAARKALPLLDQVIAIMEEDQSVACLSFFDTWMPRLNNADFLGRNTQLA